MYDVHMLYMCIVQVSSDIQQQTVGSRVAAVGPYIQSSTMPRGQVRHELVVKPTYPDGTSTLPAQERTTPELKASTGRETLNTDTPCQIARLPVLSKS